MKSYAPFALIIIGCLALAAIITFVILPAPKKHAPTRTAPRAPLYGVAVSSLIACGAAQSGAECLVQLPNRKCAVILLDPSTGKPAQGEIVADKYCQTP